MQHIALVVLKLSKIMIFVSPEPNMTIFLSHCKLIKIYRTGDKARELSLENI